MTREFPEGVAMIGVALENAAGGYLRNMSREPGIVCQVCGTPWGSGLFCNQCSPHARAGVRLADRVASMTYAPKHTLSGVPGQAYVALRGYKADRPQGSHVELVGSLLGLGINGHMRCAHQLAGVPNFRWTTVPSTRRDGREHPVRALAAARFTPGFELEVRARPGAQKLRAIQPENFEVIGEIPAHTHVGVIDDAWVTGGSAQSVAAVVSAAGASQVSILTAGRVLGPDFPPNAAYMRSDRWKQDFDFRICPWTGGACP